MKIRVAKVIEVFANVAIIAVALMLGVVLVKNYLLPGSDGLAVAPRQAPALRPGVSLPAAKLGLAPGKQYLVIVLSDGCPFCTDSADFYKRLVQAKAGRDDMRVVAVLPQPVEQGRAYLNKLGVEADEVKQLPVGELGVRGTPTLITADGAGVVTGVWVGKLPAEKEDEVVGRFSAERAAK